MTNDFDDFLKTATPTEELCEECGCKMYKDITVSGGGRQCRNGHTPSATMCDDCGEEVMEHPTLGRICGCDR